MDKPTVPNIPKISPKRFIGEVISELKKVTWPSRDETIKLTAVVIVLSVAVGAFIGALDSIFLAAQKLLVGR
jgi:preprotein translocase subunit SecE